jgi:hypothetical protein
MQRKREYVHIMRVQCLIEYIQKARQKLVASHDYVWDNYCSKAHKNPKNVSKSKNNQNMKGEKSHCLGNKTKSSS